MAGSWKHVVTDEGRFISEERFPNMIENLGDAYEALEECVGMVMWLANGNPNRVKAANEHYELGLARGVEHSTEGKGQ